MEPLDPELRRIIREGLAEAVPGADVEARVLAGVLAKLPPGPGGTGGTGGEPGAGASGGEIVGGAKFAGGVKALVLGGALAVGTMVAVRVGSMGEERPRGETVEAESGHVSKDRSEIEAPTEQVRDEAAMGDAASQGAEDGGGAAVQGEGSGAVRGRRVARGAAGQVGAGREVEEEGRRGEVKEREVAAGDALLAESRGVAEAEAALGGGDFAGALARVRALDGSHPAGQLRLEREAVEVCARCGLEEVGAGEAAREFLLRNAGAAVAGKVRARCAGVLGAGTAGR